MPFRKYVSIPNDPGFREALILWARKFTTSDIAARRAAQRTIDVLCDNPNLLDGRDINEAIFKLLRLHAFDEIEFSPEQGIRGDGVVSENEPMC
ncbi:hypothetical protein FBZ99_12232 [Rhizobium sp. ERR 1071]|uniref:hypothetical protein n=1 Tax=Rhizobium sp. ERR 1071 TaxID=2572677 RepID=UPI0011996A17|nr:hypothetical protein [Rhizobium sp. ERR1071]TWB07982.1 hypothetical protein FBZ99_12232 [Rhizobium sp. ERR1071]